MAVGLATTGLWSVALVMDLVSIALRYTIAARLLAGWVSELEPRRAWAMGGTAAILLMIVPIGSTLVLRVGMPADPSGVVVVLAIGGAGEWVGLLLAFAMGLGRGTARRVAQRRVVPRLELGPAGG